MKRTTWFITGGILLVALLAGGAYVGGRLLSQQPQAGGSDSSMGLSMSGGPGGPRSFRMSKEPAPELPQTPADAQGIFVRSEDRSIFVGTGQVTMMAKAGPGQAPQTSSDYDGPVVEVVINQDTTIYRDTTKLPDVPSGDLQLQQTVAPGSVDEIGQNSMLQVWGKKTGDRIVAQVVVYSQPTILNAKPGGG
jgi:hypothetical protein